MKPIEFKHVMTVAKVRQLCGDVNEEVNQAEFKFPLWPVDISDGMQIINEEMGESNKAALDYVYDRDTIEHLREELIQTAAMCIRMIGRLDISIDCDTGEEL